MSALESIGYRRVALRGYRLLWIAAAPFYVAAMLVNLIWACLWMPDLKPDTDADALGWESNVQSVSPLNSQRAGHLVANSTPSIN